MIKVAFCDDDLSVLTEIKTLLEQYCVKCDQKITYAAFHSSLDLMIEIEEGVRFDILFLDVIMPGENGINVAKEIRQYDTATKIIFFDIDFRVCGTILYGWCLFLPNEAGFGGALFPIDGFGHFRMSKGAAVWFRCAL